MDKVSLGRKIKEARLIKGLTQAQLAELVSLHEKHISRIESGKYMPTLDNIVKIFKTLDIEFKMSNLDINTPVENNVVKTELLKFINNSPENELEFYLTLLKQAQKGLIKYKDRYILIDKEETDKLLARLEKQPNLTVNKMQLLHNALSGKIDDYDFDYEYINIDELSSSGLSELLQALNIDESNFGTPYLSITNNGDVTAEQSGALDREALFNFLQESGMIASDVEYKSEYPNLTMIDYARYTEILESGEKSIVVIGQTGCMYCEETKPVLNEIAEEYDITINYLNITDLSEEDSSNLMNSVTYLKELESFGTPLTMVIENQEVVGHQDGYVEKSVFEEFFREQGFIE